MKLHLPKRLFTALIAAISFLTPAALTLGSAAWGLTESYEKSFSTTAPEGEGAPTSITFTDVNGQEMTYDYATGLLTFSSTTVQSGSLIFEMRTDWTTGATVVETDNTSVDEDYECGILANEEGSIMGVFDGSNTGFAGNVTKTNEEVDAAAGEDNQMLAKVSFSSTGGTTLDVWDDNGFSSSLFTCGALKAEGLYFNAYKVDSSIVKNIYYEVAETEKTGASTVLSNGNGWRKSYSTVVKNAASASSVGATIVDDGEFRVTPGTTVGNPVDCNNLTNAGDVIVHKAGVLYLQTWYSGSPTSGNNIDIKSTDLYLGSSSNSYGSLRLAAWSGNITLGDVFLVEDATITKEKAANGNIVTFAGELSGAYTLTLKGQDASNAFNGTVFSGAVNLSGLKTAGDAGVDVSFTNTVNIGTLTVNTTTTMDFSGGSTTVNGLAGSGTLNIKGNGLTLGGNNTGFTGYTTVAEGATLTLAHTKALGTWNGMNNVNVLGRVTGAGTLIIDFESQDSCVAAKGTDDNSSMGAFTGVVDIKKGQLYVGNNYGAGSSADASFGASKVIVRNGAKFWTHMSDALSIGAAFDLLSGSTLGNKDGHKEYTGAIRFNIVDPYAEQITYNTSGTVTLEQQWKKNLVYSGVLSGAGIVEMTAPWREAGAGSFKLTNNDNTFAGRYKLVDSTSDVTAERIAKLILGGETVAQYADVELAGDTTISQLVLNQDSIIKGLYGSAADNLVTVEGSTAATLTVSCGDFGGKLTNGQQSLSLNKVGTDTTLTLSGDNTGMTGGIAVSGGTLAITTANALGGGSVSLADGTILDATAVQMRDAFTTVVSKTSGEGLVKFTGGDFTSDQGDAAFGRVSVSENITVAADVQVNGDLAINSWSQSGAVVNTTVNKALTVNGDLRVESQAALVLSQADSAVSADTITLGHADGSNAGHIALHAGSLTTGSINLTADTNTESTLTMTGGELSIHQEGGAIAAGAQVKISGGTLKAADASWTLNLDAADSIGNVTFNLAAEKSISVEGETLVATGALTLSGSGTLNFNVDSIIMSETVLGSLRAESGSVAADENGFSTLNYYFVEGLGNGATFAGEKDKITVTVGESEYEFTTSTGAISGTKEVFIINTTFGTVEAAALEKEVSYFHVNRGGEFTLAGDIEGGMTLSEIINTSHGGGTLKLATDYKVTGQDAFSLFGGTVKVDGSTLSFSQPSDTALNMQHLAGIELVNTGVLKVAWGTSLHAGTITMNDGTSIEVANGGAYGNEMTADIVVAGTATLKGGSTGEDTIVDGTISGTGTLNISNLNDNGWQIASDISGNLALNIASVAKNEKYLYITGNNTFSGGTKLTDGVLHTGSTTALGTGLVTITDNSKLRAVENLNLQSGISAASATVEVADSKTLFLGASSSIGTLNAAQGTISLADGADLSLGGSAHAIGTLSTAGASTINLAAGSTLNAFTKEGSGTITLTGSGTYALGSGITTLDSGISLGNSWTGTVTLSTIPAAAGLNMNNFGNADSKVKLDGISGWFERGKFNPHIVLGDNGLTFDDYSPDKAYNFANGISGNGNFVVSAKANTITETPFIAIGSNSDTSLEWSGKFKVDNVYGSVTLLLNGGGTYFDAESATAGIEMNDADNTLSLYVGYATATNETSKNISEYDTTGEKLTTINGAISNNSTGNLELTVLNDTVFNKNVTVTSMTVNSGKTATMNATLKADTVNLADQATISGGTMSNVQMSSTGIDTTATDGSKGSINNALVQLARDASFTIQDMTLTGTTSISATEGTAKVTLNNVTATSHLKLNATAANSFVAAGGDESPSISYSYDLGLGSANAETNSITLNLNVTDIVQPTESGLYTLTVTLSNFDNSVFNGLNVDAWKALVGFDQESWLGTMLKDQGATYQVAGGAAQVAEGNSAPTVSYGYSAGDNVGTLTITITGLNVPEPTTSTLSLLALAALAARRRRK